MPEVNRIEHAAALKKQFDAACAAAGQLGLTANDVMQVTYLLQPHALEQVKSLERLRSGICLLNVVSNEQFVRATVGVPLKKLGVVESILAKYATDPNIKRPKHQDLVENSALSRGARSEAPPPPLWGDVKGGASVLPSSLR